MKRLGGIFSGVVEDPAVLCNSTNNPVHLGLSVDTRSDLFQVNEPMPASQAIDFNLFTFAKTELSHSAFWAWVLQTLCPDCPSSLKAIRPLARNLLQRMGAANFEVTKVETELRVERSPKSGRMDVVAFDTNNNVIVIEHKVGALPRRQQVDVYTQGFQHQFNVRAARVISCGIVQPLSDSETDWWIGPRSLQAITLPNRDCHPLVSMYADWLDDRICRWDDLTNLAINGQEVERKRALRSAEGQWGYMSRVAKALIDERVVSASSLKQSNGSSHGQAWTQLRFFNGAGDFDALFYRLDVPGDIQFTLKQYQRPPRPRKAERLTELREAFYESAREGKGSFEGLRRQTRTASAHNESRIARISLTKVAPSTLIKELPGMHAAFVQRLRKLHWPVDDAD